MTRKPSSLMIITLALGLGGMSPSWCLAQAGSGPAGPFHAVISNPESVVWDLGAISGLKAMDYGIHDKSGSEVASLTYEIDFSQNGSGKLSGAGLTPVNVSVEDENGDLIAVPEFQATYKVTGSISSTAGRARGSLSSTLAGVGMFGSKSRRVTATRKLDFQVDNRTKLVKGTDKRSASATGKGSITETRTLEQDGASVPSDGAWTLDLALLTAANGKTVTGTATATLHSGQTYTFAVKGTYTAKTQLSKLVLTGTQLAKGSSLQVTMLGSNISLVKGKISGQFVNTPF